MNRKIITTILIVLVSATGWAQKLKMNEPSFSDYMPMLQWQGYEVYSFDIRKLKGKKVRPCFMEYVDGKGTEEDLGYISHYPPFEIKGKTLIIGFMPNGNDSVGKVFFSLEKAMSFSITRKLKPVFNVKQNKNEYLYGTRPFELQKIRKDEFVPLVLYGSHWYDEKFGITRFCGANYIKPDMSSDILKDSPHYYVIGIKVADK